MNPNHRRVFFIGIGGSGMEPLARFALLAGYEVSGSDSGLNPARVATFTDRGAAIYRTHAAENLNVLFSTQTSSPGGVSPDVTPGIVVYSSAIPVDHVERRRAQELAESGAVRLLHRMEFLNECFADVPEAVCVAGTHGKTSSSSMAGWVLLGLGLDPHVIVGGKPLYLPDGVRYGGGRTGACETDESDGSFLNARPTLRLVLNVDHDHLEHYGDFAGLCAAFARFVAAGRLCVLNAGDAQLARIGRELMDSPADTAEIFYYRTYIEPTAPEARTYTGIFADGSDRMQVYLPGESQTIGALQLRMPGRHFAGNALGVFALIDRAVRLDLLRCPDYRPERVLELLAQFPGVERRMEYLGERQGAAVYDDYGHHPTEIRAVLAACRVRMNDAARLIVVFQPHRYTRTRALFREFAEALSAADVLFLLPLYSAGETEIAGVDSGSIAREIKIRNPGDTQTDAGGPVDVHLFAPTGQSRADMFRDIFAGHVQPGDLVVCLGAGDISAGIREYLAATEETK